MHAAVALALLVACGRVGFDAELARDAVVDDGDARSTSTARSRTRASTSASRSTRTAAIVEYTSASGHVYLAGRNHGVTGVGFARMDTDADNRQLALSIGWIGELYDAAASAPGFVGGPQLRFTFNGLDVSLRYLAVIAPP